MFSVAWVLGALAPFGFLERSDRGEIAYALLTALVEHQLRLGHSAIVDGMVGSRDLTLIAAGVARRSRGKGFVAQLLGGGMGLPQHRRLVDDDVRVVVGINPNRDRCPWLQATDHEPPYRLSRLGSVTLVRGKLDIELHRDGRSLIDVGTALAETHDRGLA